jgi:alpha-galactosidase
VASISVTEGKEILYISNRFIRVGFNLKTGRLSISRPELIFPRVRDSIVGAGIRTDRKAVVALFGTGNVTVSDAPLDDVHGKGREIRVLDEQRPDHLELTFTVRIFADRPFVLMRLGVKNVGSGTPALDDLFLLDASRGSGGCLELNRDEVPLNFFKVGWHDWCYTGLLTARDRDVSTMLGHWVGKMYFNPTTPISRRRGDFWGEGWGIVTDQKMAVVTGFASTANQFGQVHADCNPGRAALTLVARADGISLDPGEEFLSEWGFFQFVDLPHPDPAAEYVETVARIMRPRVSPTPPPAKWTHWYHFFHDITEDLFIQNLEVIDTIRKTVPFHTVQLDDGYQSAWGDWTKENEKFPNGLKYLAGRVAEKGFVPGLWLAPFVADPKSDLARNHPDWLVKDAKGKPIIGGYFWEFFGYVLDLSNPAVLEWLRRLMETVVKEWGFGFVKTDFVYAGALPGIRYDRKMTRAQAFRKGMETIREGIGDSTYHLGCGCPFGPSIGIVDAMRIGPDTAPDWKPFIMNMRWASPLITREKCIAALRNNIRHTLNLGTVHNRWWTSDPDCLMVRNYDTTLTDEEIKSNVSLIGLQGGLVINADDLTRLSVDRQRLISLLLPVISKRGRAVDLLENEMVELYALDMEKPWGGWTMAAQFNWNDKPSGKRLDLESLSLDPTKEYHVFDFWDSSYRLHSGRHIDLPDIPVHGCKLLRLCESTGKATVVGGTLHITCGGEVQTLKTGKGEVTLAVSDLGRLTEGELWLWLPGQLTSARTGKSTIPVRKRTDNVWALQLSVHGKTTITVTWHE